MRLHAFLMTLLQLSIVYQSLPMEQNLWGFIMDQSIGTNDLLNESDEDLLKFITQEGEMHPNLPSIIPQTIHEAEYNFTRADEVVFEGCAETPSTVSNKKKYRYNLDHMNEASSKDLQLIAPYFELNQFGQESKYKIQRKNLKICPFDSCKEKLANIFGLRQHISLIHVRLLVDCPESTCLQEHYYTLAALRTHLGKKHKNFREPSGAAFAAFKKKLQQSLQLSFLPLQSDLNLEFQEREYDRPEDLLTPVIMPFSQFTPNQIENFQQMAPYFGLDAAGRQRSKEIKRGHQCLFCSKTWKLAKQLIEHMTVHLPIDMRCPECNILFEKISIGQLITHKRSAHKECIMPYSHVRQIYKENLQKILQNIHSILSAPALRKPQHDLCPNETRQIEEAAAEEAVLSDEQSKSMPPETQSPTPASSVQDDLIEYLKEFEKPAQPTDYYFSTESLREELSCTEDAAMALGVLERKKRRRD